MHLVPVILVKLGVSYSLNDHIWRRLCDNAKLRGEDKRLARSDK